ncbi:hypothetical protein AAFF_G00084470 [Aldrovandia affinis]|uniref:Interleukin-4 receptor alpha N-terminal domain-containing protein n=1 Tax=Aldrovandia affinis TaxID=143900 RepID=A0AAD7RWS1_9TELE|nr:hypothetical protein AAFF_G00084470 [Aldrovandia affinis]
MKLYFLIELTTTKTARDSKSDTTLSQPKKIRIIMCFLIFLAYISFISRISYALTGSPLNCINDFERTMVCYLTNDKPGNCSRYSLIFIPSPANELNYTCILMNNNRNSKSRFKCGCTIKMQRFVIGEEYTVDLLEGMKTVNSTRINLRKIKPKAPEILSVKLTDIGNFNVTWKTNYEDSTFTETLKIKLHYKMKGEPDEVAKTVEAYQPFQEILGSDFKASEDYVIKARSFSTEFNTQFSDWSEEVEWTIPASTQDLWKIVIPVVCLLLIVSICACRWCYKKLKARCEKIPNPAKASLDKLLHTNNKVLQPPKNPPISHICIDQVQMPRIPLSDSSRAPFDPDPDYRHASEKYSALISPADSDPKYQNDSEWSWSYSGHKSIQYSTVMNGYQSFCDVCKATVGGTDLGLRFHDSSDVEQHIEITLSCSMNPTYASLLSHGSTLDPCGEEHQALQSLLWKKTADAWFSVDSSDQAFSEVEYGEVLPQLSVMGGIFNITTCVSEYESVLKPKEEIQRERWGPFQTASSALPMQQISIDDSYHSM